LSISQHSSIFHHSSSNFESSPSFKHTHAAYAFFSTAARRV
jgi:hypothetical protein